jgi:hypothetical protein
MTAGEKLIPDWLKRKQEIVELEEAQREAGAQGRLAAGLLIERQRPKFWQQLVEKLKIAIDALPEVPALKLAGSLSPFGSTQVRLDMRRTGLWANTTYTDLFCDEWRIRCTTLGDGAYNLEFCTIGNTEIAVVDDRSPGTPMDADYASQYIMGRMVNLLERQHR